MVSGYFCDNLIFAITSHRIKQTLHLFLFAMNNFLKCRKWQTQILKEVKYQPHLCKFLACEKYSQIYSIHTWVHRKGINIIICNIILYVKQNVYKILYSMNILISKLVNVPGNYLLYLRIFKDTTLIKKLLWPSLYSSKLSSYQIYP